MKADNTELAQKWWSNLSTENQIEIRNKFDFFFPLHATEIQIMYDNLENIYQSETSQAATPESVEQAAYEFAIKEIETADLGDYDILSLRESAEHYFIQGAKWQSEQSPSTCKEETYDDLSAATEEQKGEIIKEFGLSVAENALKIFLALGLETHIETMVINKPTNQEFILTFKTVKKHIADLATCK